MTLPLTTDISYLHQNISQSNGFENVCILVYKKEKQRHKKRKKNRVTLYTKKQRWRVPSKNHRLKEDGSSLSHQYSMPELTDKPKSKKLKIRSSEIMTQCSNPYKSNYTVNMVTECTDPECLTFFNNPISQAKLRIYRCQLSRAQEACCCSCNSDAMFEVMKSLYDCYKKKNCDRCNCILCGHLPREERQKSEMRKSSAALAEADRKKTMKAIKKETEKASKELVGKTPAEKEKILKDLASRGIPLPKPTSDSEKALMEKVKSEVSPLDGKTPEEQEKILRALAMKGIPLPEGKTHSEKKLIDKVIADLGLPPAPKTTAEKDKYQRALEASTPLEGKSPAEKVKILRRQQELGIPLPEGRTPSEKALIAKIKAGAKASKATLAAISSAKLKEAKAAGLLTPLSGKTPEQKETILKGLAKSGIPLPEAKTASEKKLIEKVRTEIGLPPEPTTASLKKKYTKAQAAGIITPLEGKTSAQKEQILKAQAEAGIPLPEGNTPSEKALIAKVKASTPAAAKVASEKLRKAKAAGLLTPLEGKTPAQKEKLLRGLAKAGIPLPEPKTASEKILMDKIRVDMGLPPEPDTASLKKKYSKAQAAGLITPLEGKTPAQKEKIVRDLAKAGIPLPQGKSGSEKKLISKIRAEMGLPPEPDTASLIQKYAKAQAAGLMTPLEGKTLAQKEKILKSLAEAGIPLPEGRTPSEKALIAKIKASTLAPTGVRVPSEKLRKAKAAGLLTPLEGKSSEQKEKILKGLAKAGIPLPEPRTSSEKKLMDNIRAEMGLPPEPDTTSLKQKYAKAQAAGLITPLEGKTPIEKEKILRALAEAGIPLPEGRTPSEKALIAQIKATSGAPSAAKVPSEKLRKAKAAGLITPLEGKSPEQKEKILKGLAKAGIPLPEPKTASEKKLMDKVRAEVGLPPEPDTASLKKKYAKAQAAGLITPLEGKTQAQQERILKALAEAGIPLPEGRTPSEKALIAQIKASAPTSASGLMTPLEGKSPEEKEKILRARLAAGVPLPEGKTASEKKLIQKLKGVPSDRRKSRAIAHFGSGRPPLSPAKATELDMKTAKNIKESTGPVDECICDLLTPESAIPLEKRKSAALAASKTASEKLRKAKAAGLITPLEGKTPEQKEKILKGLAKAGIPLPEPKTASEKKLMDKIRAEVGLPPEPDTASLKQKYENAQAAGLMTPLEGKTPAQKEKILKSLAEAGIPLPEGRTPSEKALIAKVKASAPSRAGAKVPSEKLRKAKAAGLLTPLEGKTPEQKEKILKGLAKVGVPLPEPKTPSEKKLIDKIRTEMGLPPEPETASLRQKYAQAQAAGLMTPLEGKTPAQKEQILRSLAKAGIPLPEGRTPSEKALIAKVKASAPGRAGAKVPSEKLRKAKAAGLLTPLEGKTPEQKEKILKGLAKAGIPLPEPKTPSEKKLIDKLRTEIGLPPEPDTASLKQKYAQAQAAGLMTPLEGKTPAQKEKILRSLAEAGIPLPEGRTPSEKALIAKIQASAPARVGAKVPSEKLRKAKAAGLLTPLEGKTPKQKEKILKVLAKAGIPLPEPKTASEKKLMDKIRAEVGLPPEPDTASLKQKYDKAQAAGLITPLEGKTSAQKEKNLKALADAGIPLPEGRTPSEKALIAQIKATSGAPPAAKVPSEKLRKAKAAGLITPLEGKSPEQKEKILKGLAKAGIPLPEPKTASEKKLMDKVRAEVGLPPEPDTASLKKKYAKAQAAGLITPLEGKTQAQQERILKALAEAGIPLPEGRTPSEKALIAQIKASAPTSASGLMTPLEGKSPEEKEKILRARLAAGVPLPEGKTASEKKLIQKLKGVPSDRRKSRAIAHFGSGRPPLSPAKATELDMKTAKNIKESTGPVDECICDLLTPESAIPLEKRKSTALAASKTASEKLRKAKAAGLITPLEGKTPEQKEKILKGLAKAGIPLPEPKTASEKKLMDKIRAEVGLPPEPDTASLKQKYDKAQAAGLMTPLEGKTSAQKEKILKALNNAGIPLPEGRTSSEKALIADIKAATKVPSEKLRKAKEAGLLTPLEGKTPAQKEKILRGLTKAGIPLPEGKTASEKKLIAKVRTEMGLPPEPDTASLRKKYTKAQAAGIITPLEGKTSAQKEKILRSLAEAGIPLPEGKTASDKALIAKVKASAPAAAKLSSGKDPLEGKTPEQKKKILQDMIKAKVPLPEGKTPSEKAFIAKVKAETEGLLTPLSGKTPAQKEKILKGLADAGLPIPEGKTASEKAMIKKIRIDAGLPPEPTASEKVKMKSKSRKVGEGAIAKKLAARGVGDGKVPGITEEFEDILKTTTCDRGCGCDKKKIRFKHSYVKIRVTSPDISSLCPCPEECIPGVKGGIITDNEGIKVTVGRAIGVPSFYMQKEIDNLHIPHVKEINSYKELSKTHAKKKNSSVKIVSEKNIHFIHRRNCKFSNAEHSVLRNEALACHNDGSCSWNSLKSDSALSLESQASRYLIKCWKSYGTPLSTSLSSVTMSLDDSKSSYASMLAKTESSISFSTESIGSIDTISVISIHGSSITSTSSHYLCVPETKIRDLDVEESESESFTNEIDYSRAVSLTRSNTTKAFKNTMVLFRISQSKLTNNQEKAYQQKNKEPEVIKSTLDNHEICKMVKRLLAQEEFSDQSSIFLIVSDDNATSPSESVSSTICLRLSTSYFGKYQNQELSTHKRQPCGLRLVFKGKGPTTSAMDKNNQPDKENIKIDEKQKTCSDPVKQETKAPCYESKQNEGSLKQGPVTAQQYKPFDQQTQSSRRKGDAQFKESTYYSERQNEDRQVRRQITELLGESSQPKALYGQTNDNLDYETLNDQYGNSRTIETMYENFEHNNDYLLQQKFEILESLLRKKGETTAGEFEKSESKTCQVDIVGVVSHRVAMDTTEDRPCCCPPKEPGVKFEDVASEIMIPIIASQGLAQGLSQEAYLDVRKVSRHYIPTHMTTSISICDSNTVPAYQQNQQSVQQEKRKDTRMVAQSNMTRKQPEPSNLGCQTPSLHTNKYGDTNTCDNRHQSHQQPQKCQQIGLQVVTQSNMQLGPRSFSRNLQPNYQETTTRNMPFCDNRKTCSGGCDLPPPVMSNSPYSASPCPPTLSPPNPCPPSPCLPSPCPPSPYPAETLNVPRGLPQTPPLRYTSPKNTAPTILAPPSTPSNPIGGRQGLGVDCAACDPAPCDHKPKKKEKAKCTCHSKENVKCVCHSKNWIKFRLSECPCTIRQTQTPPGMYPLDMMNGPSGMALGPGSVPSPRSLPPGVTLPPDFKLPPSSAPPPGSPAALGYPSPPGYPSTPSYPGPPGYPTTLGYPAPKGYPPGFNFQRPNTNDFGNQCPICDEIKAQEDRKKDKCVCKSKRKRKNAICECPPYVEPPPIQYVLEIDEKEERRRKSDLCQTTSGFNIRFKKRPPVDEEMSFEDALKYFDELEGRTRTYYNKDACDCPEKTKKKIDVECECPYVPIPEPPPPPPEPELKGFKMSVGGKGSASKGLAGVCCFDLILTDT